MNRTLASVGAVIGITAGAVFLAGDAVSPPPPPANLEVKAVGPDFVQLGWGPSQPGEFYPGAATDRSLVINWGPSRDDDDPGPITYTVKKGTSTVVSGVTRTYATVGFKRSVRTFRTCVTAYNVRGQASPAMCATWSGAG
jgi:hypothetical protein